MLNLIDFSGKIILIAGGAKGIGKETAVLLSKLGAKLILLDLDETELLEAVTCLEGDNHTFYKYDLSNLEGKIRGDIRFFVKIKGRKGMLAVRRGIAILPEHFKAFQEGAAELGAKLESYGEKV